MGCGVATANPQPAGQPDAAANIRSRRLCIVPAVVAFPSPPPAGAAKSMFCKPNTRLHVQIVFERPLTSMPPLSSASHHLCRALLAPPRASTPTAVWPPWVPSAAWPRPWGEPPAPSATSRPSVGGNGGSSVHEASSGHKRAFIWIRSGRGQLRGLTPDSVLRQVKARDNLRAAPQ